MACPGAYGKLKSIVVMTSTNHRNRSSSVLQYFHNVTFIFTFQERKERTTGKDSKTIKQLLGELYADKEYLEKLWGDTGKETPLKLLSLRPSRGIKTLRSYVF